MKDTYLTNKPTRPWHPTFFFLIFFIIRLILVLGLIRKVAGGDINSMESALGLAGVAILKNWSAFTA